MSDPTNTATRYITSLNRHLRKRGLGNTVISIRLPHDDPDTGEVSLYPWDTTDLAAFAVWLRSLRGPTVTVWAFSDKLERSVHLMAVGGLDDGTATRVRVIVDGVEFDLLSANTPLVKDADIPVELLLSLVSATAAESRTDDTTLAGVS